MKVRDSDFLKSSHNSTSTEKSRNAVRYVCFRFEWRNPVWNPVRAGILGDQTRLWTRGVSPYYQQLLRRQAIYVVGRDFLVHLYGRLGGTRPSMDRPVYHLVVVQSDRGP